MEEDAIKCRDVGRLKWEDERNVYLVTKVFGMHLLERYSKGSGHYVRVLCTHRLRDGLVSAISGVLFVQRSQN